MARRRSSSLALSGEHAQQALAVLVHDGKLAVGEVQNALKRHRHLVTDLRAKLAALEEGAAKVGKRFFKDGPFPTARIVRTGKRKAARRKPRISAATRKIYQEQGRYMAALRNLSKEERARIKAIREKSGVRAAISAAKGMAR
jgi:N-methylhydantoinase B/oxoprolinase/acetone carboxylase alpha subunit